MTARIFFILLVPVLLFACKKEKASPTPAPSSPSPTAQGIQDIDGNTYDTLVAGGNTWMKQNLRVSKYRNGDSIVTGLDWADWQGTSIGAYAYYDDASSNNSTYGKLYNGYAVADARGLCPSGWHVATDNDWIMLEIANGMLGTESTMTGFRGLAQNVGGKLKSTQLWSSPNTGANNSSGFTALPGGFRYSTSVDWYIQIGIQGHFWTSTSANPSSAWTRFMGHDNPGIFRYESQLTDGFSCRCVRD